jgi:prepilin-type N-terminal cleavage/methylation domain-containing protein
MTSILIRKWNKNGFTLLEIIISLGLISIALLAVLRLQAQNLNLQSEAQFITVANYLVQDRLSRIQSESGLEPGHFSGDFGSDFPYFRYQEEIEEITDIENLLKVSVTIILDDGESAKDLLVTTYHYREKL